MVASRKPFLIGIAGGTCCGKSEVCKRIIQVLGQSNVATEKRQVIVLGQGSFYRELSSDEQLLANAGKFNFDHPSAFDDDLTLKVIRNLKAGQVVQIPQYDFKTHTRCKPGNAQKGKSERQEQCQSVYPAEVILFEGILVLYNKDIRNLMDMKIFVDTDSDTRLARRVLRDTTEHDRDIDSVLSQYTNFVKPAFEDFTLPTKKYADVIIPRGADNSVAINLIVQHIQDIMCGEDRISPKRNRTRSEGTSISGVAPGTMASRPH